MQNQEIAVAKANAQGAQGAKGAQGNARADAIPFPQGARRKHEAMTPERIKNAKRVIQQLKSREGKSRDQINEYLPEMISGVFGGDNIALINRFLGSLSTDRKRAMTVFLRRMVPYSFKDGQFTKKGDNAYVAEKLEAFNEFLDSGQTVFVWIAQNTKTEEKPVDYAKRVETAISKALSHGLAFDDVMGILTRVANEKAEKAA